MTADRDALHQNAALLAAVRNAARQEQFLEVVAAAEARRRFEGAIDLAALAAETIELARAADTIGAGDRTPQLLLLNTEVIACGHPPALEVRAGTASPIATGGAIPRGADAVVMIEHTELIETPKGPTIEVRRAAAPGQFVAFAGSDMARGETVLRRGQLIGSREIGILAACGIAEAPVVRRPKVAVLSTGDELVPPGMPLPPAGVYDSNGAIAAAAVEEAGGEAVRYGAFPDDEAQLEAAVRRALAACDIVVLSGGTSKGAG